MLKPIFIVAGLDDGNYVEVLGGDLKLGDMVVTNKLRTTDSGGSSPSSSSLRLSTLR